MKIVLILTAVILASLNFWGQENTAFDCEQYHKGKYYYIAPNGGEVYVNRRKKKQIERYNDENQRFIFTLNWTSNCEYTLTLKKTRGVEKTLKKEIIGTELAVTIIKLGLDQFTVSFYKNDQISVSNTLVTFYSIR